jgi:hypothetical protein
MDLTQVHVYPSQPKQAASQKPSLHGSHEFRLFEFPSQAHRKLEYISRLGLPSGLPQEPPQAQISLGHPGGTSPLPSFLLPKHLAENSLGLRESSKLNQNQTQLAGGLQKPRVVTPPAALTDFRHLPVYFFCLGILSQGTQGPG